MRFILGFTSALGLLIAAALTVVWTGAYDVAATDPHADPIAWALETTMANSVERRADGSSDRSEPADLSEADARTGFTSYDAMCVHCHGAPGVERAEWAKGLRPSPPDLAEQVRRWNAGQLFWIVKHGIKMSGMPALAPTHEDAEIWPIVAFLQQLPEIDAGRYAELRATVTSGHHGGSGGDGGSGESGAASGDAGAETGGASHEHGVDDAGHSGETESRLQDAGGSEEGNARN